MSRFSINFFNCQNQEMVIARLAEMYKLGKEAANLTDEEVQFVEALELAHSLMLENKCNREDTKRRIIAKYDVSPSTAYNIIDYASKLMATETVSQHRYHKLWLSETLKWGISAAKSKQDLKELAKLGAVFMQLHRLDDEVNEKQNYDELFRGIKIEVSSNPKLLPQHYSPEEEQELFIMIDNLKVKAKKLKSGL